MYASLNLNPNTRSYQQKLSYASRPLNRTPHNSALKRTGPLHATIHTSSKPIRRLRASSIVEQTHCNTVSHLYTKSPSPIPFLQKKPLTSAPSPNRHSLVRKDRSNLIIAVELLAAVCRPPDGIRIHQRLSCTTAAGVDLGGRRPIDQASFHGGGWRRAGDGRAGEAGGDGEPPGDGVGDCQACELWVKLVMSKVIGKTSSFYTFLASSQTPHRASRRCRST